MLVAMIVAAVLAQAPAETAAPTEATKAAGTPAAEKPKDEKKICVVEQQMGSHFKRKICATAEEWDRRREKDARNMSRVTGDTQ